MAFSFRCEQGEIAFWAINLGLNSNYTVCGKFSELFCENIKAGCICNNFNNRQNLVLWGG